MVKHNDIDSDDGTLDQLDRIEEKLDKMLELKADVDRLLAVFGNGAGMKMAMAIMKAKKT